MERRVLMDDAPVMRRALLADAPAEGVALPVQGELDLSAVHSMALGNAAAPDPFRERLRHLVDNDAKALEALYDVLDADLPPSGTWACDRVIYDRTAAFSVALEIPVGVLMPGIAEMTPWSKALPPTRGWWLVREQPGGEMSVLWFEPVVSDDPEEWPPCTRIIDGDWYWGDDSGINHVQSGLHSELTNIEWCGLAKPWSDVAPIQRRVLLELS